MPRQIRPRPVPTSAPPKPGTAAGSAPPNFVFEQTQMSSDRTLMSTVRTSLSLISFGFTIYQVLGRASGVLPRASVTARNVGLALLVLGLATLLSGLLSHSLFARQLARRRAHPEDADLVARAVRVQMTTTYVSALCLLIIGLATLVSIAIRLF